MAAPSATDGPVERTANVAVPRSRYVVFFTLAIVGCAADLLTKHWVFADPDLRNGKIAWLWTGHVGIQLSRNLGALFGMAQGKYLIFAVLGILAAIAIPTWLFVFRAARDGWLTFALGCIMGGVVGNLYDRLGLSGDSWYPGGPPSPPGALHAVRDWILWQVSDTWRWPNFNIADSLLVCGAALLFWHALRQPAGDVKATAETR